MERTIKTLLFILILCFSVCPVLADYTQTPQQVAPQYVSLPQCIKSFNVGFEKLFYLTEVAASANNYTIDELQSQGGYIIFSVDKYRFIATVVSFGSNKAILKITPCNNNYNFPLIYITKLFSYIEVNQYKKF